MINQEVALFIDDNFPEILIDMPDLKENTSLYKLMHAAVLFTTRKIKGKDFASVKVCMNAIGRLHQEGSNRVKIAIENIYIYSFTGITYWLDKTDKRRLQEIIPPMLQDLYADQLRKSSFS